MQEGEVKCDVRRVSGKAWLGCSVVSGWQFLWDQVVHRQCSEMLISRV